MSTRRDFLQRSAALGLAPPLIARAQPTPELARILVGFPPGGTRCDARLAKSCAKTTHRWLVGNRRRGRRSPHVL